MTHPADPDPMRTKERPSIGISYLEDRGNPMKLRLFDRLREWAEVIRGREAGGDRRSKEIYRINSRGCSSFDLRLFELDVLVHETHYVTDINPVVSLEGIDDGIEPYERLLRTACRTH